MKILQTNHIKTKVPDCKLQTEYKQHAKFGQVIQLFLNYGSQNQVDLYQGMLSAMFTALELQMNSSHKGNNFNAFFHIITPFISKKSCVKS
jgi:hypothetical protein